MPLKDFKSFQKIARWKRNVVITEKIDGTNAQIYIEQVDPVKEPERYAACMALVEAGLVTAIELTQNGVQYTRFIAAGSRTRWISPGGKTDNFGFAGWVFEHAPELAQLGPGEHFGEWWGYGIQRGYGLPQGDRRFSLFNVHRFAETRPACCSIVPVLYQGPMAMQGGEDASEWCMRRLRFAGSQAAPFMDPEGICVFHTAANSLFKYTLGPEEQGGKEAA